MEGGDFYTLQTSVLWELFLENILYYLCNDQKTQLFDYKKNIQYKGGENEFILLIIKLERFLCELPDWPSICKTELLRVVSSMFLRWYAEVQRYRDFLLS